MLATFRYLLDDVCRARVEIERLEICEAELADALADLEKVKAEHPERCAELHGFDDKCRADNLVFIDEANGSPRGGARS